MNQLKKFLKKLTDDGSYYAEMVENVAEIYISSESKPVVLLEFDGEVYHVNFRCDLTSQAVAMIMSDMIIIKKDIVAGADFYSSDAGITYGDKALATYFSEMVQAFEDEQMKKNVEGSIFIVKEPIYAHVRNSKNRAQRLRRVDLR